MDDGLQKALFADLSARAARGEQRAFARLVDEYHKTVYRLALRIVQDADAADDVAQETFIRVWQGLPQVRDFQAVRGWICSIARNVSHDRQRTQARQRSVSLDEPTAETNLGRRQAIGDPSPNPESRLVNAQRDRAIQQALASLKEKHRLVLALREMDDMTYDEIATALGCSVGTVESRLHRARKALAKKLKGLIRELGRKDD
jgi:RNA polymerase sigma-70 factor (ECF subfamily)